jgi:hypothetical protein
MTLTDSDPQPPTSIVQVNALIYAAISSTFKNNHLMLLKADFRNKKGMTWAKIALV